MNVRSVIGVTTLLMGVVACGGKGAPEQAAAPAPSAQAPASVESSPAAVTAGSPAVDIAALNACEIVTPQEAATIIGGKLLNEPPVGFSNCAYVVEVDGTTESYRISFSAPSMYVDHARDAERCGAGRVDCRVVGRGVPAVARTGERLLPGGLAAQQACARGVGDRKEPLIELARLAVSRVP